MSEKTEKAQLVAELEAQQEDEDHGIINGLSY